MGDRKDLFGCGEKVKEKKKRKYFYLVEKKNERIKNCVCINLLLCCNYILKN